MSKICHFPPPPGNKIIIVFSTIILQVIKIKFFQLSSNLVNNSESLSIIKHTKTLIFKKNFQKLFGRLTEFVSNAYR